MIRKDIPCDNCIHNKVCNVRKQFEETEVKTTHPYIIVKLECTEFYQNIRIRQVEQMSNDVKDIEINGCITIPTNITHDEFLKKFIDFIE